MVEQQRRRKGQRDRKRMGSNPRQQNAACQDRAERDRAGHHNVQGLGCPKPTEHPIHFDSEQRHSQRHKQPAEAVHEPEHPAAAPLRGLERQEKPKEGPRTHGGAREDAYPQPLEWVARAPEDQRHGEARGADERRRHDERGEKGHALRALVGQLAE